MNEILEKVKNLDIQQLTSLKEEIDKFIKEKQNNDKTYVFEASLEGNTYRGAVYVAKLELKGGKINREFKKLTRTFIDNYKYILEGKFTAKENEVLEYQYRISASGKTKYRKYFIVENGELKEISGDLNDIREILKNQK
jgi:hypothetical protein